MHIGRGILEPRTIAFHVGVCHLLKTLSEQTQLPDCAWASAMKAFHDVHDNLFGNITIAIILLAVEAVFVLRFIIPRQRHSNHQSNCGRLMHSIFPILRIVGREVVH
jgi:hypothetical protein